MYEECARQGLKALAPPLEKVAASTVLLSSRCRHPPPHPTQQLRSSWENLASLQRTSGTERRCSPPADASLCLDRGRDGWDHAWDGARWERERGGCFQNSCSHPARIGVEGNLSQFIYLFTVFKAASCGIHYRSSAGGLLRRGSDT